MQTGLLLGPGGEFSFVIVTVALAHGLLDDARASLVLIVAALTMISTPILSKLGARLVPRAGPRPIDPALMLPMNRLPATPDTTPHVIVAGFGRVGQTVAAMLEAHHVAYVAIDRDPDRVALQRKRGRPVYYGDMTRTEILRHVELDTARALVVTLDDRRGRGSAGDRGAGRAAGAGDRRPCP